MTKEPDEREGGAGRAVLTEIHLRNIFDAMIEGVQIIDFDWRHIYVNDAVVRQSHYSKEELVGYTMMERYPGIEQTKVFEVLKNCMEKRISTHVEIDFEFPADKRIGWFELSIQPIQEGIFILSVDITDRKQTEEKLKRSEQEYRNLIDQATDGIFISDPSGKYLDVNQSACDMLGYSKDELLKLTIRDLLAEGESDQRPPMFDVLRAGKTLLTVRDLKRKDNSFITVEINSKMLPNGNMLGMVRDISERIRAQKELNESEEKFRKLTETTFDAIILLDKAGKIISWNKGAESIFGFSAYEVMLQPFSIIIPQKYNLSSGRVVELQGAKKDGSIFPVEVSITSWQTTSGSITGMILRDISDRKDAERRIVKLNSNLELKVNERTLELQRKVQQLAESEEKFQKSFEGSAAGMSITRMKDQVYMDVNEAFVALTGFSREELVGHTSVELGLVADMKSRKEILDEIQKTGRARHFEIKIRNKYGRQLNVLSSVETILLNGEKFALNIIYDITERKEAEEQIAIVNKELEAFSYSVSHDLRAPLRSILGYLQIFQEDHGTELKPEAARLLKTVRTNAEKMNKLIDDLLAFAKLGKSELMKSLVNTNEIVRNALAAINGSSRNNVRVRVHELPDVFADPDMIAQVWLNLISNAFKYSSKSEQPAVEIGAERRSDNHVVFFVKDNGVGFDMAYSHKLFGVFSRLHGPKDFEGTGVGLSIVKRIVTKHGGEVWAEATLNKGATFYFTLPA